MEPSEIAVRRMRAQRVWGTPLRSIRDVFAHFAALQSQEFGVAGWSIAQRTRGIDHDTVMRAYSDGSILRTHALRPTWHFVSPADIRWIQALTGPRVHTLNASRYRELEIDAKLLVRSGKVIARALAGGDHLTRKEIAAALSRSKIDAAGPRLGYLVMSAELDAVICSGAMKGKQFTYALVDERVPPAKSLDRDDALAELTRRYLTSRGPATLKDFTWWSSLTAKDARQGVEAAGNVLASETVDGRTYWFSTSAKRTPKPGSPRIDLAQGYDELLVSYTRSKDVLTRHLEDYALTSGRPLYLHAVLLDGRLVGHWKPQSTKGKLVVEAWFYRRLARLESKALEDAVARFGRFMGVETSIRRVNRPG